MNLKEELLTGKKKLGVWGLGYIGFSSIAYFARAGVTCIGTDVSEQRISDVNGGNVTIPNLRFWLGFDTSVLAKHKQMSATKDWKELIQSDVAVHLITIPTEMNGKPYHDILKDVVDKISGFKNVKMEHPSLVIVESTLTPTVADSIVIPLFEKDGLKVGKDILFGIAPRRDWFTSPDKTLNYYRELSEVQRKKRHSLWLTFWELFVRALSKLPTINMLVLSKASKTPIAN